MIINHVRIKLNSNIIRNLYRGLNLKKPSRQVRLFLLLDALIILFCIPGIYQINQKADLPFNIVQNQGFLTVDKTGDFSKFILPGDILLTLDGRTFSNSEEIEIYLDSKSIGDNISIDYLNDGIRKSSQIALVKYYTTAFVISNGIAGLIFIIFGIFVLLNCPDLKAAKIFHWGSIGITVMLLYTWGKYTVSPPGVGIAVRVLYQFAYVFAPAAFLHFSFTFPKDRDKNFKYFLFAVYSIGAIIAFINIYFFMRMMPSLSESHISNYQDVFELNRIFAILLILSAILIFIISYKKSENEVEKKKLKWLLTGFLIGPLGFSVLWAIPLIFASEALIPEILLPYLMISIPVTFTIAIVRYHLMDLDFLIRRSVVYFIVIFFLIIIYVTVIYIISNQIILLSSNISSIIAALIVALLFEPIRKRVQRYVDKKFFKVNYNFRVALKKFIGNISEVNSIQQLADMVVAEIQEFIPVEKLGFFLMKNGYIRLIAHQNFDLLVNRSLKFDSANLKSDLSNPIADPAKIEAGVPFEAADISTFKRWGMDLVITIKSADGEIHGFLVLGGKKFGSRFNIEDVDLLNNVSSNIASTLSRIYLQEELIRKNLETERLEELNKQKTLFVSTVSHDLKTPLASIKVFSEMMKNDKHISDKQRNYLDVIEGESDRLTRLINNVLGYAYIEKGTRKYSFKNVALNEIAVKTLDILSYQIKMEGFVINKNFNSENCIVSADPEAVIEAVINLIANAMKFSIKHKVISVSTFRSENYCCIEVRDKGIGIKPEDLKNLFKPFFRSEIAGNKKISGTGLGLSIIKHVMDAHNGNISVESIPDEGTSFILKFPVDMCDNSGFDDRNMTDNSFSKGE